MTPTRHAIAVLAVACPHWRWMPGMRVLPAPDPELGPDDPCRVIRVDDEYVTVAYSICAGDAEGGTLLRGDLPDLDDPATLGCLLALVREAWGRSELAVLRYPASPDDGGGWFVLGHTLARSNYDLWITNTPSATEAESLVAALEAAP